MFHPLKNTLKLKRWASAAGLALAAAAALPIALPAAQADELSDILKRGEIRVAVQDSGPLVSFIDKKGQRTGLVIEIAQRMADDLGVKLVLQDYEWRGLLPALLSGKVDMIAADMTPTPQRATQVLFTVPMLYEEVVAVARKDAPYQSYQDLNRAGVEVGAISGTTYGPLARRLLPAATVKEFTGGTPAVGQAVSAGRLEAGVMALSVASQFEGEFGNLRALAGVMESQPRSFAVSANAFRLKFWLDNWHTLRVADGTLPGLVKYWYSSDWKQDH